MSIKPILLLVVLFGFHTLSCVKKPVDVKFDVNIVGSKVIIKDLSRSEIIEFNTSEKLRIFKVKSLNPKNKDSAIFVLDNMNILRNFTNYNNFYSYNISDKFLENNQLEIGTFYTAKSGVTVENELRVLNINPLRMDKYSHSTNLVIDKISRVSSNSIELILKLDCNGILARVVSSKNITISNTKKSNLVFTGVVDVSNTRGWVEIEFELFDIQSQQLIKPFKKIFFKQRKENLMRSALVRENFK